MWGQFCYNVISRAIFYIEKGKFLHLDDLPLVLGYFLVMNKKAKPKSIKVVCRQVEANPREIERRISSAFAILFNEMERTGRLKVKTNRKEKEIINNNIH